MVGVVRLGKGVGAVLVVVSRMGGREVRCCWDCPSSLKRERREVRYGKRGGRRGCGLLTRSELRLCLSPPKKEGGHEGEKEEEDPLVPHVCRFGVARRD